MRAAKPIRDVIVKRALELGIVALLTLFGVVLLTGPLKSSVLGIPIEVTHSYAVLAVLVPVLAVRLALTAGLTNMLLMLGSVAVALLVVEVALRVLDPPFARPRMTQIHEPSPTLGWTLVPGSGGVGVLGESYRISSAGFRDTEHPLAKPAGTHRIMVLGDSFTFGMGVSLEDTYPKQLERILNRGTPGYEVINCGVIGYNMWQYQELLTRKVLPYRPDLVILGLFQDDVRGSVAPQHGDAYAGQNPFEEPEGSSVSRALRHVSFWNLLRNAKTVLEYRYRYTLGATYVKSIEARKRWWGPARPADPNYRLMSGQMDDAVYARFTSALERFATTAKDADARVLVVMIPDSVQLNDPPMQAVNRAVKQIATQIGVPFVDTTPVLEAEPDLPSLYLFPYDAHNSPKGLQVIARAIARRILDDGLLPLRSGGYRMNSAGGGSGVPSSDPLRSRPSELIPG